MNFEIEYFDTIDSTNSYLYDLGNKGISEGHVVFANHQTAGRGRSGRTFESPRGNFYMSILIRPHIPVNDLHLLTPLCAVCVHRAISEVLNIPCSIKWVNDLYYNNKKVCGILTEIGLKDNKADFAVIGIGINVFPHSFSGELNKKAGSLLDENMVCDETNQRELIDRLIKSVLVNFDNLYTEYDVNKFMSYYREHSMVIGKNVTYMTAGDSFFVKVIDIDDKAQLIVQDNGGELHTFYDGEISIKDIEFIE